MFCVFWILKWYFLFEKQDFIFRNKKAREIINLYLMTYMTWNKCYWHERYVQCAPRISHQTNQWIYRYQKQENSNAINNGIRLLTWRTFWFNNIKEYKMEGYNHIIGIFFYRNRSLNIISLSKILNSDWLIKLQSTD